MTARSPQPPRLQVSRLRRVRCSLGALPLAALGLLAAALPAAAQSLPPIRIAADNAVPSCVTPRRLMAFLTERNPNLDAKFRNIAEDYRRHGEALRVRWDYAFFQMVLETNYLTFRRGDGSRADVDPSQNNFAGLGTTGGGVAGDSFPDVSTGVLAQIQHLVVYSGERVGAPVAPRTRLKQDDILGWSEPLARRRPVTFKDLAGKWATDRAYARSIAATADRFRAAYCNGTEVAGRPDAGGSWSAETTRMAAAAPPRLASRPAPAARKQAPAPVLAAPHLCRVLMASYGGRKALLIRHHQDGVTQYTALRVLDGFERSMADSFMRAHAPDGTLLGEFPSNQEALAKAYELCPADAPGARAERAPNS